MHPEHHTNDLVTLFKNMIQFLQSGSDSSDDLPNSAHDVIVVLSLGDNQP